MLESGVCSRGSLDKVLSGKHYNRALRVHKLMAEGFERLHLDRFKHLHSRSEYLTPKTENLLRHLTENPSCNTVNEMESSKDFLGFYRSYQAFKSAIRDGQYGKTARCWLQCIDIVKMVLMLIRATKDNNLD